MCFRNRRRKFDSEMPEVRATSHIARAGSSWRDSGLPTNIPLPKRKDWRIGVLGLGGISPQHLEAYQAAGFRLYAAADLDPVRRAEAKARFGFEKVYADYSELIADADVEVVSLLTQPTLREAVLVQGAPDGFLKSFAGPMADFLRALEDGREPALSGRRNLHTLRQVFAERDSSARQGEWVGL